MLLIIDLGPIFFGLLDDALSDLLELFSLRLAAGDLLILLIVSHHTHVFGKSLLSSELLLRAMLLCLNAVFKEVTDAEKHLNFLNDLLAILLKMSNPGAGNKPFINDSFNEGGHNISLTTGDAGAEKVDKMVLPHGYSPNMKGHAQCLVKDVIVDERLLLSFDSGELLEKWRLNRADKESLSLEGYSTSFMEEDIPETGTYRDTNSTCLMSVLDNGVYGQVEIGLLNSTDPVSETDLLERVDS